MTPPWISPIDSTHVIRTCPPTLLSSALHVIIILIIVLITDTAANIETCAYPVTQWAC